MNSLLERIWRFSTGIHEDMASAGLVLYFCQATGASASQLHYTLLLLRSSQRGSNAIHVPLDWWKSVMRRLLYGRGSQTNHVTSIAPFELTQLTRFLLGSIAYASQKSRLN